MSPYLKKLYVEFATCKNSYEMILIIMSDKVPISGIKNLRHIVNSLIADLLETATLTNVSFR